MVMSSNKIGRRAMEATQTGIDDILKSAPAMIQSDGKAEAELKAAAAPKKAQSFSEAFKAARAKGEKNFTWFGKSYAAKMAGEGGSKASAPKAASRAAAPKGPDVNARTKEFISKAPLLATRDMKSIQNKPTGSTTSNNSQVNAGRTARKGIQAANTPTNKVPNFLKAITDWNDRGLKRDRDAAATPRKGIQGASQRASQRASSAVKKAKGGSIDGCAIRGKTRASLKKGK